MTAKIKEPWYKSKTKAISALTMVVGLSTFLLEFVETSNLNMEHLKIFLAGALAFGFRDAMK